MIVFGSHSHFNTEAAKVKTAREIAEWYAPTAAGALERDILRHMELHMERAAVAEREACAKIADERAAICRDAQKLPEETLPRVEIHTALEAEHIASLIRKRNRQP